MLLPKLGFSLPCNGHNIRLSCLVMTTTETPAPPIRLTHKKFLPWQLLRDDCYAPEAFALRAWSTAVQTGNQTRGQGYQKLKRWLEDNDMVVDYRRDDGGFCFVPRDPKIDDPDLPVRRPPSV